jgi:FMN phosphatase YigB (HAD superfamily)
MTEVQAILFWLSGVFTPSNTDVLFDAVSMDERSFNNLSALVGFQALYDQLSLGLINDLEYCQTIYDETHLIIKPETITERILKSITTNESIYEIINLLPENYQFWLIVDYPDNWFRKISERLEVHRFFPMERTIFLSKCGLSNTSPDLFEYLPNHINFPIDRCLLVDNNQKRVIKAINYGLPSIIYVDAQRLKREFILRKLISKP